MGRRKSTSQELEQYARGRLRTVFSEWIVNSRDDEDFGFDFEIRLTEADDNFFRITPSNFFIQLKASENFEDEESVYWDLDVDYIIEDCLQAPIPVVLMIYERESDHFYWCVVQTYCWDELDKSNKSWREQRSVRMRIERNPLRTSLDSIETFANQSKFRQDLTEAEDRISFRRHIDTLNLETGPEDRNRDSIIVSAKEIEEYKRRNLEAARELLNRGSKSRALPQLMDIYQMPERDGVTLEAIMELIETREITHPIIAFAQDEFAQTGIGIAKETNRSGTTDLLRENRINSERSIRKWVPGARVYDREVEQEILVLAVEDWAYWAQDESMWIALLQYEDGDFRDETAAAIMGGERYEILELDESREPYLEGCSKREHEFPKEDLRSGSGPALCKNCGFSEMVVMEFLNHYPPFVCEICDSVKEFSKFTEGHICESCRDSRSNSTIVN